jgi:acyl-CoA synthetase (AMP-forming)/AMP-acid ligase II
MYAPLNPALTRPELAAQLDDCHPSLVIVESDVADQWRELVPSGSRVWPTEDLWSTSVEMPLLSPGLPIDPDGPAFLFYTSGTTGRAKGVQLSHRNVLTNARQVLERTGVGPQDRLLVVMPIFHVNGLCNQVVLPFLASASIALRPRFVLEEFWPNVVRYQPTYFTAVPTILSRLLDGPDPPPDADFQRYALRELGRRRFR